MLLSLALPIHNLGLGGGISSGTFLALTSFLALSLQVIISFPSGSPPLRVRWTVLRCSPTGAGWPAGVGPAFWPTREQASGDSGLNPNKAGVSSLPQSPLPYKGSSVAEAFSLLNPSD